MTTVEEIRTVNLNALIKKYGGFQAFAEKVERERSQIEQWARNYLNAQGNPRYISSKSCRRIENILSLPDGWMDQDHAEKSEDSQKRDIVYTSLVPIRGSAKLGESDNYFVDMQYPPGAGDGNIIFPTRDKDAYAVKCDGDSMLPRIKHGEYAIIEPNREVNPGDEVLVQDKDGQVMIKVFSRRVDGRVYFESINAAHLPFSIPAEKIESMQYVAGVAKSALKVG
ncbi:MAG: S24 family peptidase [Oxalobacter sp.]|nr:S24 family peptidase [Oxalobacter sp.]